MTPGCPRGVRPKNFLFGRFFVLDKGQNRFRIFLTLFRTFSEIFPQDFPLQNKGF